MTAIKTVTLDNGIVVEDAIHRIESVKLGYKNDIIYTVRQYVSLDKPFFAEFNKATSYSGGDVYRECYMDLTSNSDYSEG